MKIFTKKKNSQKIMIVLLMVIVLNFSIPNYSQAVDWNNIAGDLLKELVQLVASFGDIVMGALNHFMLGTDKYITSAMLDKDDANLSDSSSWLFYGGNKSEISAERTVNEEDLDGFIFPDSWKIPNFLYCPENIFANKIAALDVNFVRAHEYTGVQVDESSTDDKKNSDESKSEQKAESAASGVIRTTIASWYNAFRNIAVVGLLTVLVYLGIRIVISSTATDKAKYKESLQDWLVALCLVFVIHIIMSGIMMFTDKFTEMIDGSVDKPILVTVTGGDKDLQFKTNLTGFVRFKAQNKDFGECTSYTIMYIALVLYTVMFTFTYFKRFLYMAFFTMIAPLVALTYPIDKVKDGKAQAFDMWFREYTMNAIIQPVHLILYSVFIGSAIELAVSNPIYAIVTLAFLTSAEKWVKSMFGLDKAKTPAGLATMAGGALAMKGVGKVMGMLSGKGMNKDGSSAGTGSASLASRGVTPGIKMDKYKGLTSGMEAQQGSVQNSVDGQSQNTNEHFNQQSNKDVGHDTHSIWKKAIDKKKRALSDNQNQNDIKQPGNDLSKGKSNNNQSQDNENEEKNNDNKTNNKLSQTSYKGNDEKKDSNDLDKQKSKDQKKQQVKRLTDCGEKEAFKQNRIKRKQQLEELREILSKQSIGAGDETNEQIIKVDNIGISDELIDWRRLLRETITYDVDWSYRNASIEDGVLTPYLEDIPKPETEIVLDTSGSTIDENLLRNFLRECKSILKSSKIKVGCFDTKFYGFTEIRNINDIDNMEFVGGGGTDFNAAVNAFSQRVENKIIFTDGYADMPNKYLDAIWIVFGNVTIKPKGGKVIQISLESLYNINQKRR